MAKRADEVMHPVDLQIGEPVIIEQEQVVAPVKKVDIKAWRERKLMAINKLPSGKAKKAAERIFRNKEA